MGKVAQKYTKHHRVYVYTIQAFRIDMNKYSRYTKNIRDNIRFCLLLRKLGTAANLDGVAGFLYNE